MRGHARHVDGRRERASDADRAPIKLTALALYESLRVEPVRSIGCRVSTPTRTTAYVEPDVEDGVQLDDDVVAIDAERALALLDASRTTCPAVARAARVSARWCAASPPRCSRRQTTVIEAGTGIGKSLAYLIPAVMSGQRVVVATATKNLQDQLAPEGRPDRRRARARACASRSSRARQNYLCRNRAQRRRRRAQLSFDDGTDVPEGVADQMRRILAWSNETETGDRDELPFEVDAAGVARPLGDAPGVPAPRQLSPGPELLRRTGEGPRRRVVDAHRQHPPLRRPTSRRVRCCCPRTSSWSSTRPTRSSTSSPHCSARRSTRRVCARLAGVARPLLGAEFTASACVDLVDGRRPLRGVAADPVRPQRADRARRGLSARTGRANELVVALVEGLRALTTERRRRGGAKDPRPRSGDPPGERPRARQQGARRRVAVHLEARPRGRRRDLARRRRTATARGPLGQRSRPSSRARRSPTRCPRAWASTTHADRALRQSLRLRRPTRCSTCPRAFPGATSRTPKRRSSRSWSRLISAAGRTDARALHQPLGDEPGRRSGDAAARHDRSSSRGRSRANASSRSSATTPRRASSP